MKPTVRARRFPLASPRHGFTLVEMIVTLALLGLVAMVVAPAFRSDVAPTAYSFAEAQVKVHSLRQRALRDARTQSTSILVLMPDSTTPTLVAVSARPDGSVVTSVALGIARLSGVAIDAFVEVQGMPP
ncbi:MAG: prepilin-type N-terminal cleavage/methylation domain-containing protein [Gemmatimonadales bacterium]